MDIKKTFIRLTNYTCPHGQEEQYLRFLPKDIQKDRHGNYFYKIGESKSIFACHLDTVSNKRLKVNHIYDGKFIKTDGKSILGADDKAGLTIILYMIHNRIPGLYYFFIGEEVGCVGSGKASKDVEYFSKYKRIISFDRRDTHSIITHQSSKRSCSDAFAGELANQLNKSGMNMRKDDTGVYTDSAEFVSVIQECTNISVGYYSEHTMNERQDIEHLNKLCEAVIGVDWEKLPTVRNKNITEYKSYTNYGEGYYGRSNSGFDRRNSSARDLINEHYGYEQDMDFHEPFSRINPNSRWLDESDEEEIGMCGMEDGFPSRTPRTYFDGMDGLTLIGKGKGKKIFDNIKDKYLDDRLSDDEIEIIKSQLLDLSDPSDLEFAKELESMIRQKSYGF